MSIVVRFKGTVQTIYHYLLKKVIMTNLLRAIASAFRVVAGRKAVTPHLKANLTASNHILDDHFVQKEINMKFKPKKKKDDDSDHSDDEDDLVVGEDGLVNIKREGVFCKDLDAFTNFLIDERGLNPDDTMIKVGMDDGQGY